jgi:hypothetical protein
MFCSCNEPKSPVVVERTVEGAMGDMNFECTLPDGKKMSVCVYPDGDVGVTWETPDGPVFGGADPPWADPEA